MAGSSWAHGPVGPWARSVGAPSAPDLVARARGPVGLWAREPVVVGGPPAPDLVAWSARGPVGPWARGPKVQKKILRLYSFYPLASDI